MTLKNEGQKMNMAQLISPEYNVTSGSVLGLAMPMHDQSLGYGITPGRDFPTKRERQRDGDRKRDEDREREIELKKERKKERVNNINASPPPFSQYKQNTHSQQYRKVNSHHLPSWVCVRQQSWLRRIPLFISFGFQIIDHPLVFRYFAIRTSKEVDDIWRCHSQGTQLVGEGQ